MLAFFLFLVGLAVGAGAAKSAGDKRLAEREEAFKRLVSGEQGQGPYRDGDVVHYLDAAHASVRPDRCQDKIAELQAYIVELQASLKEKLDRLSAPNLKRPEPTSLPSSGSDVWK